jgi:hypothetical protein
METLKPLSRIEQLQFRITHAKENYAKALNCVSFIELQPIRQNIEELEEELKVALAGNKLLKS